VFLDPVNRTDIYAALQASAASQGFEGDVAMVWEDPQGRTRFLAPPQQHPFFQVVSYDQLRVQANATIAPPS
jgi:hypothetical protein